MTITHEISHGIRVEWACRVVNVCQTLVGQTLDGDPTCIDWIAGWLRDTLPRAETTMESLYACHQLVIVLGCFDDALHQRFHSRFLRQQCHWRPDTLFKRLAPGPRLSTDEVILVWQTALKQWFDEHHIYPPALRAKALLTERLQEPWTTARLTIEVGASRTPLLAEFEEAFGMRPKEYLVRLRLREGLRRLRLPHADRTTAVNSVGYVSPVKFAARLRRCTSYTPARLRRVSEADFQALIDERLPLRKI